jgi:hypothetical protein
VEGANGAWALPMGTYNARTSGLTYAGLECDAVCHHLALPPVFPLKVSAQDAAGRLSASSVCLRPLWPRQEREETAPFSKGIGARVACVLSLRTGAGRRRRTTVRRTTVGPRKRARGCRPARAQYQQPVIPRYGLHEAQRTIQQLGWRCVAVSSRI